MGKSLVGHGTGNLTIRNRKVKTLALTFRLINAAGTGSVTVMPVLRNINVEVTLTRNNVDYTLAKDNLQNLAVFSHWHKGLEPIVNSSYLLQRGNGQAVLPIRIQFPGCIDLQDDDEINVTIQTLTGTYSSGFNTGQTSMDYDWIDSLGREEAIPFIRSKFIASSDATPKESLGSGVARILVVNYDQAFGTTTNYTDAQNVFSQISVRAEKYNITETGDQLQSRLLNEFETPLQATIRGQSHMFLPTNQHKLLDDVQVDMTLVGSLITASNNAIIWSGFTYEPNTTVRAYHDNAMHNVKEQTKLVNRVGVNAVKAARNANEQVIKQGSPMRLSGRF